MLKQHSCQTTKALAIARMSFILLEIAGACRRPRRRDRPGSVRGAGKLTERASEMSDRDGTACKPKATATPLTRSSRHAGDDFRKLRYLSRDQRSLRRTRTTIRCRRVNGEIRLTGQVIEIQSLYLMPSRIM